MPNKMRKIRRYRVGGSAKYRAKWCQIRRELTMTRNYQKDHNDIIWSEVVADLDIKEISG